jgi:hypothetical protein
MFILCLEPDQVTISSRHKNTMDFLCGESRQADCVDWGQSTPGRNYMFTVGKKACPSQGCWNESNIPLEDNICMHFLWTYQIDFFRQDAAPGELKQNVFKNNIASSHSPSVHFMPAPRVWAAIVRQSQQP